MPLKYGYHHFKLKFLNNQILSNLTKEKFNFGLLWVEFYFHTKTYFYIKNIWIKMYKLFWKHIVKESLNDATNYKQIMSLEYYSNKFSISINNLHLQSINNESWIERTHYLPVLKNKIIFFFFFFFFKLCVFFFFTFL